MVGKWKKIAPDQILPRIPGHHTPAAPVLPRPLSRYSRGEGHSFSQVLFLPLRRVAGNILTLVHVISPRPSAKHWRISRSTDPDAYPGAGSLIHTLYICVYNHSLHILTSWRASKQRKTPVSHVPIIINSRAKSKQIFSIRPEFRNFLEQNKLYF